MNRSLLAAPAAALALCGLLAGSAMAQAAPPSVAQLCAATGIEDVDTLLTGVAGTELVGALQPLATLTVPDSDHVTVKADVTLDQVRTALDCDTDTQEPTPTPDPTETVTPAPTTTATAPPLYADCDAVRAAGAAPILSGQPGYRPELDSDRDGIACEVPEAVQSPTDRADDGDVADAVPQGSVNTGGY